MGGRLEHSGKRVEGSIRVFVMGRNNSLFSNTPDITDAGPIRSHHRSVIENGLDHTDNSCICWEPYLMPKKKQGCGAASLACCFAGRLSQLL